MTEKFEELKENLIAQGAMSAEEICAFLGVDSIQEYLEEGYLVRTRKGTYLLPQQRGLVRAVIHGHKKGFAFGITEDGDYFLPHHHLEGAIHGDTVFLHRLNLKDRSAQVERIVKRNQVKLTGTFTVKNKRGFLLPDDGRYPVAGVKFSDALGAKKGDKVYAQLSRGGKDVFIAKVLEVLGREDEAGVDIQCIVREFGLRDSFPEEVRTQASTMPRRVEDVTGRLDLRKERIFTVDGEDALDFDDAISISLDEAGNYRLGVHIADVSHYVEEGSPIDREAELRGTSVYLLDRVIPMLPFALSNEICSLKPNEDRFALSVLMTVDREGNVIDRAFHESVICSCERMTYTNVTKILKGDAKLTKRYQHILKDLQLAEELMHILRNKRHRRGALDFDVPEAKAVLDERGRAAEIVLRGRENAHRIIEEFMILANETVAETLYWMNQPCIYRVHENPDEGKMDALTDLLNAFGYGVRGKKLRPAFLQGILEACQGNADEGIIKKMLLRSMKKAVYSEENLHHFGLASQYYCHFTSPIRRYPDLVVHRQLKKALAGRIGQESLASLAKATSHSERNAAEAEYAVDDMKKAEYMQERIGEKYEGIVCSITGYGFYVELPNTVEGMVRLSDLKDRYDYNEKMFRLVCRHTRKSIALGDRVLVKVKGADKTARTVDFEFIKGLR